jgi:hypothetical protein
MKYMCEIYVFKLARPSESDTPCEMGVAQGRTRKAEQWSVLPKFSRSFAIFRWELKTIYSLGHDEIYVSYQIILRPCLDIVGFISIYICWDSLE